ncbi:MAG: hypothetical protein IPH42_16395 [Bacteroidetes bacterium]|nr:hypothetical protein [Bacteroidota bacterium]
MVKEIVIHRGVVMNPFSHYDLEKPEFEKELSDTIAAVEKLKAVDAKKLTKETFEQVKNEVEELNIKLAAKEKLIVELGAKLNENDRIFLN